jgi:hypothetical protein
MLCLTWSLSVKLITFKANQKLHQEVDPTLSASFTRWFRDPSSLEIILKCNPGLASIEKKSHQKYFGMLSPLEFPGVTVRSSMEFDCRTNENPIEYIISCNEDSMKQEYEGNPLFASWLAKLLPKVVSSTKFFYDEHHHQLINDASLTISFQLPSWFPIAPSIVEQRGSATIEKNMQRDMQQVLSNVVQQFENEINETQ